MTFKVQRQTCPSRRWRAPHWPVGVVLRAPNERPGRARRWWHELPREVRAVGEVFCGIDWGGYHHQPAWWTRPVAGWWIGASPTTGPGSMAFAASSSALRPLLGSSDGSFSRAHPRVTQGACSSEHRREGDRPANQAGLVAEVLPISLGGGRYIVLAPPRRCTSLWAYD